MGYIWISYEAQENWYGSANVEVTMTYENNLSDTVSFVLNILPVNDPPESFSIVYRTITDTISISTDTDETLHFSWEESVDVDSEVSYTTTVTLDYSYYLTNGLNERLMGMNVSGDSSALASEIIDGVVCGEDINAGGKNYFIFVNEIFLVEKKVDLKKYKK